MSRTGSRVQASIKPYRSQDRMDDVQASKMLDELKQGIGEIHNQNTSELSFEELYRKAYNLVLHKHGDKLYNGIENEVRRFLGGLGEQVASSTEETLLEQLVEVWKRHDTTMKLIRDILMYLDRTFVVHEKKEPTYDLGLRIFREEVHMRVKDRVLKVLLSKIKLERQGELIERDVVRSVLQMEVEIGVNSVDVYEADFEREFLEVSKKYYQQESMQFMQQSTCPDYLIKAERRLDEEKGRAQAYLHYSTEEKLLRIVSEEMVVAHCSQLVNMAKSGCRVLLKEDKVDDLRRMYKLFSAKDCREEVKSCMFEFVKETGEKLVEDENSDMKPVDFVRELLDLQEKYDRIVKHAFNDDKVFQRSIKEAFEFFVNKNQKCSQFLSMYLDELMRNKIKLQTQDEMELGQKVDRVVLLFRYLQDKDIFENFYKQQLAKRLLSGRSVSEDAESMVIKKLKTECGYLFTSKLEGMFKDMRFSKEIMDKFLQSHPRSHAGDNSPELRVTVLTAGFWPTESAPLCTLPAVLTDICDRFKTFYLDCHSGRRLTWQTNLGSADVRARFSETASHEFNVSTYQMCILLLFNDNEELSFQQIQDATNISGSELKRHLISLAAPKFRILHKEPKGRVMESDTKFFVNKDFKSSHYRVRVPLVSTRENLSGAKAVVPEQVEESRRHLIEAAIVRIMKARKTLEHNLLIAEVTKQLSSRFAPSPQLIKRRTESLLEREYLERDPKDHRIYRYLA